MLRHIETPGSIDIPDFMVTRSKHSVHLISEFHAFVDGTNGDVELERVSAAFLKTRVLAQGKIVGHAGQHGKTTSVELTVHDGRIQDVLRLFVSEPKPPLNGTTSFRAHVVIPPEKRPFVREVQLSGDFGIEGGQFTKTTTQKDVDTLSEKARGAKPDDKLTDADPERVISNLAGHVELRVATATFSNLSFNVPGALAQMHGTYNLESEAVDLHGTLTTDTEFSKMSGGFKSVLLKPFDVFFKRNHAGAVIPVHLIGKYHAPEFGLDLPAKTFRNGSVQTVVSPYSVRRKPHAPVSTPLAWSEVKPTLNPSSFNIGNFVDTRLKKKDPWRDFFNSRQALKPAIARLKEL